jgi:pimeloyl-ACP methyl ester carboxylesterase
VLSVATTVLRGWRRAGLPGCGGEAFGHDWTRIAEAGREICRFDSQPWVHELAAVPTAVIATTADDIVPPHRQLELAAAIPNATLRRIEGGHAVCTTNPRRFVPALVDACAEVAQRAIAVDDAA